MQKDVLEEVKKGKGGRAASLCAVFTPNKESPKRPANQLSNRKCLAQHLKIYKRLTGDGLASSRRVQTGHALMKVKGDVSKEVRHCIT